MRPPLVHWIYLSGLEKKGADGVGSRSIAKGALEEMGPVLDRDVPTIRGFQRIQDGGFRSVRAAARGSPVPRAVQLGREGRLTQPNDLFVLNGLSIDWRDKEGKIKKEFRLDVRINAVSVNDDPIHGLYEEDPLDPKVGVADILGKAGAPVRMTYTRRSI